MRARFEVQGLGVLPAAVVHSASVLSGRPQLSHVLIACSLPLLLLLHMKTIQYIPIVSPFSAVRGSQSAQLPHHALQALHRELLMRSRHQLSLLALAALREVYQLNIPFVGLADENCQFVCIVMLSDAKNMVGGETAFRRGDGTVALVKYPAAGYAIVMQASTWADFPTPL